MSSEARRLVDEVPVFAGLTPEARAFVVDRLEPMTLIGGDVLMHQGDPADALVHRRDGTAPRDRDTRRRESRRPRRARPGRGRGRDGAHLERAPVGHRHGDP